MLKCFLITQSCLTLHDAMDCSPPGYHVQLNPGLLHCRQTLSCLSHQGSCVTSHPKTKWLKIQKKSLSVMPGILLNHKKGWFLKEDFPSGSDGRSICLQWRRPRFNLWVRKIPWRRKWQPTPVLLPGKSHGWRGLVGYSPWGHKELDTTE